MNKKYQFKHLIIAFMCGSIFFSGLTFAATQNLEGSFDKLNFIINGEDKTAVDGMYDNNGTKVPASFIYQDTTYVPIRMIGSLLGKTVEWNQECKTVLIGGKASDEVMKTICKNANNAMLASNFLYLNVYSLNEIKAKYLAGDAGVTASVDQLKQQADKEMKAGPYSVTYKTSTPPSGDKHDYVSIGIYWWPNPDTPDGKPYIRKDGFVNPETKNSAYDKDSLVKSHSAIKTLALAYFYTGNEVYAEYASKLLRVWYLNPDTMMNPNLNYGQSIPGVTEGRKEGIIETINIMNILDYVTILNKSKYLPDSDLNRFKDWIAAYMKWLTENKIGLDEKKATNNHGTWYDTQVASFALFSGKLDVAKKYIESGKQRVDGQIESDGKMPQEMDRTLSLHYPLYNLQGFVYLAQLGDKVGIDLWNYESPKGGSIKKSLNFLAPYYAGDKKWELEQAVEASMAEGIPVFVPAGIKFNDKLYQRTADKLLKDYIDAREKLLYANLN
ncbi:Copper amine oxidase N-terminal domain-containing protein [Paenibacillus sp. yr247]|uniref:alginate lyase family protein n=1 Tax=Paenibacillus sp. yr247 TaxID=1761880 RepID=UPI0008801538|nr:alginate lyase family protein [Paenibacillus sp. yr247]SDP03646.1 Copper amine oxidase N-terminal domain-containing protein [Paenibacillus sp. yr247]